MVPRRTFLSFETRKRRAIRSSLAISPKSTSISPSFSVGYFALTFLSTLSCSRACKAFVSPVLTEVLQQPSALHSKIRHLIARWFRLRNLEFERGRLDVQIFGNPIDRLILRVRTRTRNPHRLSEARW